MSAKKGLGRGFESLIPSELLDESFDPTAVEDERVSDLRRIKWDEIYPDPQQPRRFFDEVALSELADSIREHGIIQPIVVTPRKSGGYVIVAGERRYRAAGMVGLDKVPALVRTLSDQHRLELSLIENLQRRDLSPLEAATAYLKLRDQFNMTLDEIGHHLGGKAVPTISNTMRLLRLPESAKLAINKGELTEGQARPLINLDHEVINAILPTILKEGWPSRRIEQYVVELKRRQQEGTDKPVKAAIDQPYKDELKIISGRLKLPISIKTNTKGAGQLVIKFKNQNEFKRLNEQLNK